MKMLKKLIPFALILTLGATAFGDDTPMEKEMSAMNKAYKALKKTVADPASKDANLKLIAEIKKTTETSAKMEPKTTADQPAAGKAARPSANIRKTNSNIRLEVSSSRSKKIPPNHGRRNRSIIRSLNPCARSAANAVVSGRAHNSAKVPRRAARRSVAIRILSASEPTGARNVAHHAPGSRQGSLTSCIAPSQRTREPAAKVRSCNCS